MQEKTLEELIEEYADNYGRLYEWRLKNLDLFDKIISKTILRQEEIISIISSREEKAREEGRKEANKESYWDIKKSEEVITQYKEELLR